jgi:GNAT superfamily N-acetyltransferase
MPSNHTRTDPQLAGWIRRHLPSRRATLDPEPRIALWQRLPLVAEEDGEVIGFAHVGPSDEEPIGEVYRLFVLPERWGTGVGRALMERALKQQRAAGFDEALLWVHEDNPRARHTKTSDARLSDALTNSS